MASSRPSSRVEVFDVLAPAGTLKTAPLEVATGFLPGELVGIEIVIPDGHNGLTGIQIAAAHAPILPRTAGAWIVGNDDVVSFDLIGYPNGGAYSAFVYNSDLFAHTFHVRFEVADFAFLAPAEPVAPLPTPLPV